MTVMVAVPYRTTTPRVFVTQTMQNFNSLTYTDKRLVMYPSVSKPTGQKCGPHAQARNELIERELRDHDEFVLWIDVDIVRVPPDLIEVLMREGGGQICAPLIFVERVRNGPASIQNGGWFYDTGAFIKDGQHANTSEPIFPDYAGGTMQLDSVGCVYLIPADVYRNGGRYHPDGESIEHVSLMIAARKMGYTVWATDKVRCEHAYLPRYGEKWH